MSKHTSEPRIFWRSPSGRTHGLRRCSSAGPPSLVTPIKLTHEQFEELGPPGVPGGQRCRCATWTERPAQR